MFNKLQRKFEAEKHTTYVTQKYHSEIDNCIANSEIYEAEHLFTNNLQHGRFQIEVTDEDSVAAIMRQNKEVCLLNFASFRNPGGNFINGSYAQEEALCHESFLYNVLQALPFYKENKEVKSPLYKNRAIYTPSVIFERNNNQKSCNVITCACPNWKVAQNNNIPKEHNETALRSRIRFILKIIAEKNQDNVILGAFGCGAFGQNAEDVATIFKQEIYHIFNNKKVNIIFAVPKGNGNYDTFYKVLKQK